MATAAIRHFALPGVPTLMGKGTAYQEGTFSLCKVEGRKVTGRVAKASHYHLTGLEICAAIHSAPTLPFITP
jgi:hypothetical protein